jgi:pimeloyl-ACP methyl ester carboxylesterase
VFVGVGVLVGVLVGVAVGVGVLISELDPVVAMFGPTGQFASSSRATPGRPRATRGHVLSGVMPVLNVPGAALWYQESGGDGPPVVFMHPASGTSDSWCFQLDAFASAGYRCIAFDLRGWGRSKSDEGSDPGCMSDDVQALATALRLKRFAVIGAAYGAFGALDYALRFPEKIGALVLSATLGGIADPQYTAVRDRILTAPIRALPHELSELGPSYRARDPDGVRRWLEIVPAARSRSQSLLQRMHSRIMLPMLATLSVPALIIAGDADLWAPPPLMRLMADHIPSCVFTTVAEAGHCVHWECPDEWNRLVLDFLAKRFAAS